jgi:hypothetical protein
MTYRPAEIGNLNTRIRKGKSGFLLAIFMAGCSSNVVLQTPGIPVPLVEKLPVSVAVRFPPNFEHFVHNEEVLGRAKWSIDLGRSNAALFTQLFGYMFEKLTILGPKDDPTLLAIDALIEPSIEAFEFSVPNQSKTEAFAVWIRYRIKVYDRVGEEVASWPVSAYGKSLTTTMGGSDALQRAAILAMRDAAALMIMQLDKATGISLLAETPASRPGSDPQVAGPTARTLEPALHSLEPNDDEVQTTALEGPEDDTS